MSAQLEPRRFNVTEYYQMAKAGVLKPEDRVELIEGEVIKMSPIGSRHAACVRRLNGFLQSKFGPKAIGVQSPVRLSDFSEPEPDIALMQPRDDFYANNHPTPVDILVIMEVADTTLLTDRNIKVPLYARANVQEVWLVNLPDELVEVYSDPENGKYRHCETFKRGETAASPTLEDLSLGVNDILG